MAETDMREVVRSLRAENSEALLELLEFDNALDEFVVWIGRLSVTSRTLADVLRKNDVALEARLSAAQERADKLADGLSQGLQAFQQLRNAVKSWEIVAGGSREASA